MNKVRVTILGKEYVLKTPEKEEYVVGLARTIDRTIREIMKADETLSITSACILASLDAFDAKTKMETDVDNLRFQLKDYINDAMQANNKADELEKRVEQLEDEKKDLENQLSLYTLKAKLDDAAEA
ncbi:Uncharacterized protein conserved in bacteria [uncultured Ruminococcus sp.]|uniref:Cell division protein ZapA n=1 Tax=Massiliimalia timonensis TaxID=1987501 RepID=A0A8J6TRJ9_9FIRM|nr:cell division protein ZapA [Massiliimalia timonensis]MBC8610916.1 cell division protein ZapA [Massiliimalia timonensis]SCI03172.1 Uncharacterized protein conserved in bacteria [uncultured Clostridium sp.]SCI14891.1 Uncharacterized protein conserved in bacteria [uncultured Ruminococcus sp.]